MNALNKLVLGTLITAKTLFSGPDVFAQKKNTFNQITNVVNLEASNQDEVAQIMSKISNDFRSVIKGKKPNEWGENEAIEFDGKLNSYDTQYLKRVPNLKLIYSFSSGDEASLEKIGSLSNLNYLGLMGNGIKDFTFLTSPNNLEKINFHGDLADLQGIQVAKNLKFLYLSEVLVKDLTPLSNLPLSIFDIASETITSGDQLKPLKRISTLCALQTQNSWQLPEKFAVNKITCKDTQEFLEGL